MRRLALFFGEAPAERIAISVATGAVSVFVVWAALLVGDIIVPIYQNADVATAPVIAELLPERGSGYVTLGNYPWLEPLYGLHLTRWLPDHLMAWKAAPFVIYGLVVVLAGWTAMRAISRPAGLVVALAMAAPAPFVLNMLAAPDMRLGALAHVVILATFLVTAPRLSGCGWLKRGIWGLALAVTLAPGVSSDPLIVLGGVIPFLLAVGIGWRLGLLRPAVAVLAGTACVLGAAAGRGLLAIAEHNRIVYVDHQFEIPARQAVTDNIGLLLEDVALFAHGQFGTDAGVDPVNAFDAGRALLAVAVIVAVIAFVSVVARSIPRLLAPGERPVEQALLTTYWASSIVVVAAAFILIGGATPGTTNSVRYVLTFWPALLTLVVIVYGRRAVTGLAVLAAGTAIVGCIELSRGLYTPETGASPSEHEAESVERFVEEHDLHHGFAGYWDAAPITWQTEFDVRAYPIEPCRDDPSAYCEFGSHTIDSWYEPMEGVRSFYLVGDKSLIPPIGPPPAEWGPPFKTAKLDGFTIYAYDYDIAGQLRTVGPDARPPVADADRAD